MIVLLQLSIHSPPTKRTRVVVWDLQGGGGMFGALDGGSAEYACTTSWSHDHNRCEVCHLLTRDKPVASAPPLAQRKRVE